MKKLIPFSILFSVASTVTANGQTDPYPPETVLTRPRPALDPQGLRLRSFKILPQLILQEQFNDNIFSTHKHTNSDFITWMTPRVNVESDWSRHYLGFLAETTVRKYAQHSSEDTVDYVIRGNGRLDLPDRNHVDLTVDHTRNHELRQSPNEIRQDMRPDGPTTFETSSVLASYTHHLEPLTVKTGFSFTNRDFNPVRTKAGVTIPYTAYDRDRNEIVGTVQVNYDRLQRFSPFFRGSANNLNYDSKRDRNGYNRDSTGYKADVGAQVFFSGVLFGEAYIGYMGQFYDDPRLGNVNGMSGGGEITWLPSGLTTVKTSIARSINASVLGDVSGVLSTNFKVNVDHELLRNLLLNAYFGIDNDEFSGSSSRREDTYYAFGIGANYLMNRFINFGLHYDFITRDSNAAVNQFTSNAVFLNTKIQF